MTPWPTSWPELRATSLVHEDETILALNKPTGISVTGERHDTDLVEMAAEHGERLFPVHRIDKVTSGLVLLARELRFHGDLTRQFNRRTVEKDYLVITRSTGLPESGTIDLPLTTGRKNRVRVAGNREDIVRAEDGRTWALAPDTELPDKRNHPSTTVFARVWEGADHSFLVVRPVTGRRHQIRVHLAWIGHPIEGDPLFDRGSAERGDITRLHSWRLALDVEAPHARRGVERLRLTAPPAAGFGAGLGDGDTAPPPLGELLERAEAAVAGLPLPSAEPAGGRRVRPADRERGRTGTERGRPGRAGRPRAAG
ncbi:RluA family pseudouridine synthase [Streptomyces sp. ST2-7A]|uniref:RluA family pseudouridine synthase n=1 Tax=Streptomyces sp. ST2-7A TaxID=2907214 RepID=UPI001F1E3BF8|nr:RNA pseudouridine synthase [Streptomyces sp. ST2-7A]MCE7081629.1 RNA pseudouridine synthase [Streptomyces sp. ST2-7A]